MISPRQRHALLLTVLVAGAALRFAAVGWGLPRHDLGQDEMITAARVRGGVLVGHPGWPRFHWPNLNVHLSRGAVEAVRRVERWAGLATHDDVLVGRVLTAALGALTLLVLYLAAAQLFDPVVGIAAAGFLAAIPLHAFRSRLWVPDVPMTLFYTLALLAAVRILARPTYARFVAGAVAVGLATASKYNGVGACLPILVAAFLALPAIEDRWKAAAILSRLALGGAISVAVFFAVDPFALPLFDEMLAGMGFVTSLYIDVPAAGLLGWQIWRYILGSFFAGGYESVGPLISILALAGWGLLLVRRSRAGVLAWLPGLLYLLIFSSLLHDPYERMFLPLAPHIALLAAVSLVEGARRVGAWAGRTRPASPVTAGVTMAVLAIAVVPVTEHVVAARRGETRLEAAAWLDAHVPAGAFVMREWDMVQPGARHFDFNRRLYELWGGDWTPRLVSRSMDFVVTTSTNFERALRQRRRPIVARRAAYYEEMFASPLFELAAKFEPDLRAFGPEVRIYRCLHPRGRGLGAARRELDLLRQPPWFSDKRLRRDLEREGRIRLQSRGELMADKVSVRPGGWYALEVTAASPGSAPLEVGLGNRLEVFRIGGEQTVTVRAFLRRGKNWWRIGAGPGFAAGDELSLRGVRLVRLLPGRPGETLASVGRASADPSRPKAGVGGRR
jgi:hypothetical protein